MVTTPVHTNPLALAAIDLATRVNDVAPLLGALPGRVVVNPESAGRPYFVRKQRFGNQPLERADCSDGNQPNRSAS